MFDAELFNEKTQAIMYGVQANAIQRMLDFDSTCGRKTPSVVAVVNPTASQGLSLHKVFFGQKEILLPVYSSLEKAVVKHPYASVFINFASFRSAFESSKQALEMDSIKTVVIIAEGVPERRTRELIEIAKQKGKMLIGPATVGGVSAGAFKIGNSGGTIESIVSSKLHRRGSVGFVSKSGGMSNEMYNVIANNSDGVYEGVAIGGDAYPGSTLLDHALRFEKIPGVKMIVVLGELGGVDEYAIAEALKKKQITKPLVAWVTGTCAQVFPSEVQFGHAGAKSGAQSESAQAKNAALKEAGAIVPPSFDELDKAVKNTFDSLVASGVVSVREETAPVLPPMDYVSAVKQGMVRKPTNIISGISDDRGEEVTYGGVPLNKIIEENMGIGDVICLLWFRKRLPSYASKFIELVLITTADHGPCVSGAHNSIVASRAGKDVVSSLCSGLLTIGPRFGGALDDAAEYFKDAKDSGISPKDFVEKMKKEGVLIPGIGHRIKSVTNPDKRVELLKSYAKKNFPKTDYLDYALEVEKLTTEKRNNLILNVDGCVAVLFLDLFSGLNELSKEDSEKAIENGFLNGLFTLGRSIGLIGHVLDQKRLEQPLYRHPWDDVLFLTD